MPRKILTMVSLVLVVFATAGSASATKPLREVNTQGDFVIRGQCTFPVLGHIDGVEIIKTFFDAVGDPVKQIVTFPGNRITLTNLRSGISITVSGTGSSQLRARADGSFSARAMGHGPFFPNPLTGQPGIWYLSGQGASLLDERGNPTSAVLHGRLVDLCPRLTA
jgi:hypothetical protein